MAIIRSDFTGKNALVIGATSGIGRATALAFADAGANVAIAGLGPDQGHEVEHEIKRRGRDAIFVEADVRNEADVETVMAHAVSRFGRIHAAVNNAGTEGRFAPLPEMTADDFDRIVTTNLRGVFFGLRHEIPHMAAQGGGAIVNTSSIAGVAGMANISIYSASKHGIVGLTRSAALEVGRQNIRINAVAPGAVETGLLHRMVDGHVPVSAIAEGNPMGRISQPDEIAAAILWLASDAASYVNGHVLVIDGGGMAG
jgi:NAD(P)-dependent dehydrogenase (short-subunit alcohol dehydrogenase family)